MTETKTEMAPALAEQTASPRDEVADVERRQIPHNHRHLLLPSMTTKEEVAITTVGVKFDKPRQEEEEPSERPPEFIPRTPASSPPRRRIRSNSAAATSAAAASHSVTAFTSNTTTTAMSPQLECQYPQPVDEDDNDNDNEDQDNDNNDVLLVEENAIPVNPTPVPVPIPIPTTTQRPTWKQRLGLELSMEDEADRLADRLHTAVEHLLDALFRYLSHLPENNNNNSIRNSNSSNDAAIGGMTLPASALGWLSSQIISKYDNDDENNYCNHQEWNTMAQMTSIQDRLRLLTFLLPRVTHLRITRDTTWPPELPSTSDGMHRYNNNNNHQHHHNFDREGYRQGGASIPPPQEVLNTSTMSVVSGLTTEDHFRLPPNANHETVEANINPVNGPTRQAFLKYMQELQNHPKIDLRLFRNLKCLLLEGIPLTWIVATNVYSKDKDASTVKNGNVTADIDIDNDNDISIHDSDSSAVPPSPCAGATPQPFKHQKRRYHPYPTLQVLSVSKAAICDGDELQSILFSSRKTLTHLKLENCAINDGTLLSRPLQRTFRNLSHLQCLSLAHNQIERPPFKTLRQVSSTLQKLDLSHNRLTSFANAHMVLGQIKVLRLSYNQLSMDTATVTVTTAAGSTNRNNNNNNKSSIYGLEKLYSLEELYLDHNQLFTTTTKTSRWRRGSSSRKEVLPLQLTKLPFLRRLDLQANSKLFSPRTLKKKTYQRNQRHRQILLEAFQHERRAMVREELPILNGTPTTMQEWKQIQSNSYSITTTTTMTRTIPAEPSTTNENGTNNNADTTMNPVPQPRRIKTTTTAITTIRRVQRKRKPQKAVIQNGDTRANSTSIRKVLLRKEEHQEVSESSPSLLVVEKIAGGDVPQDKKPSLINNQSIDIGFSLQDVLLSLQPKPKQQKQEEQLDPQHFPDPMESDCIKESMAATMSSNQARRDGGTEDKLSLHDYELEIFKERDERTTSLSSLPIGASSVQLTPVVSLGGVKEPAADPLKVSGWEDNNRGTPSKFDGHVKNETRSINMDGNLSADQGSSKDNETTIISRSLKNGVHSANNDTKSSKSIDAASTTSPATATKITSNASVGSVISRGSVSNNSNDKNILLKSGISIATPSSQISLGMPKIESEPFPSKPKPKIATIKLKTGATRQFDVFDADWDELVQQAAEGLIPNGKVKTPVAALEEQIPKGEAVFSPDVVDLLPPPSTEGTSSTPLADNNNNNNNAASGIASVNSNYGSATNFSASNALPDHVYEDDSCISSLATNRDDFPKVSKFQLAEDNASYDGPEACQGMNVLKNLDLYFNTYVFPSSVPDGYEGDMSLSDDANDANDEEDWKMVAIRYPRIQLCPEDRKSLEAALSPDATTQTSTPVWVSNRERCVRVWEEEIIPCGKPAIRRLQPNRRTRLGFHGDQLYDKNGSPDPYAESRKVFICLSTFAFYIVVCDDAVTAREREKREQQKSKKTFPVPISDTAEFRDAPWPHAVARHSYQDLQAISIGFEFQRLTLRFFNPAWRRTDPYVYVLLPCNKQKTVSLLQEIQRLAKEANGHATDLISDSTAVAIENDSQMVFDALAVAVAPDLVGTVLHYQIVQQRWKRGERGTVRRVCVVTDSKVFLLDEDFAADGHTTVISNGGRGLADVRYRIVDEATLKQVAEVQAADGDPRAITILINPLSRLSRTHRWRLLCKDSSGAERLVEDVRKALTLAED